MRADRFKSKVHPFLQLASLSPATSLPWVRKHAHKHTSTHARTWSNQIRALTHLGSGQVHRLLSRLGTPAQQLVEDVEVSLALASPDHARLLEEVVGDEAALRHAERAELDLCNVRGGVYKPVRGNGRSTYDMGRSEGDTILFVYIFVALEV